MRVNVTIYRTAKIPTGQLKGSTGLEAHAASNVSANAVRETFGPHMAPGFKIFWPDPPEFKTTIVGMEAFGFDTPIPTQVPQAANALTLCDPINSNDTHKLDGALFSELMRMGIPTHTENYEWRVETSIR